MELEEKAKDTADNCIACTSCIAACPVTMANPEYKGPKLVGPAHSRMHFSDPADYEDTLLLCSNCKNCDISCPNGVAVSTLNMLERGKYFQAHPEAHRAEDQMLSHGFQMAELVNKIPFGKTMANLGMGIAEAFGALGMLGMAKERKAPRYATTYFRDLFKNIHQPKCAKKVLFFPGCYIDTNDPKVGVAFVEVMNQNGYEVLMDKRFVCCGSPLVTGGYLDEAREHAQTNVAIIAEYQKQGIPVIACCTSCSLMLKSEYTELFAQEEMQKVAQNVYDSFEFLTLMQERGELREAKASRQDKLIYHAPCHLRAQGMGLPALDMLQDMGYQIENADAGCCGISGSYGFHKQNYETSMRIGAKLFETIQASGATQVICDCGTCRMQIVHGTHKPVAHPIELIAEAYRQA